MDQTQSDVKTSDVFRRIAEYSRHAHDPQEFVCRQQELPPMYLDPTVQLLFNQQEGV